MKEMLRAREHGALLRDEADYQLQVIYLWYEKQPQHALDLLAQLHARHPGNPLFPQLTAQVQDVLLPRPRREPSHVAIAARCRACARVVSPELAERAHALASRPVLERMQQIDERRRTAARSRRGQTTRAVRCVRARAT